MASNALKRTAHQAENIQRHEHGEANQMPAYQAGLIDPEMEWQERLKEVEKQNNCRIGRESLGKMLSAVEK